ncbi:serine hydrolase [Kriegella sp. EG-1]|nr:serine hydrolase [Flavobacteriaceae bacterium EG-1]
MNLKIFILLLCASSITFAQKLENAHKKVDSLFQVQLKQENVKNSFLTVYSDKFGINWNYAEGSFTDGTEVTDQTPFLSTSIAKTFTATLIMMLQEEGKLAVENSISQYLSAEIIDGLHIYQGVEYSKEVTISQLLQHTSGIPDYFEEAPNEGPSFMELLITDSDKMWQPFETINFAKTKLTPHFAPGDGYHYSDTEYVLLGLLIEKLEGKLLHDVLAEKIFSPLQMKNSYMHLRSKPINNNMGKLAELYVDDTEISSFKSLSADWAGGGMATTSQDLLQFHKALNEEILITNKSLRQMQEWIDESFGFEYGYGLRKFELKKLSPLVGDLSLIGHSGTSGAFMYYCPELDVYLTGTFNQTSYKKKHVIFMLQVLEELQSLSNLKNL